jgi:hypothetical protein
VSFATKRRLGNEAAFFVCDALVAWTTHRFIAAIRPFRTQRGLILRGWPETDAAKSAAFSVIASEAKQSREVVHGAGLLRRFAPRNDDHLRPYFFIVLPQPVADRSRAPTQCAT